MVVAAVSFYYLFWVVLGVGLLPGLVVSGKRKSDGFLENIKHQLKVNWMTLQGVNFVFCIYYRAIGIINLKKA
ncbi:unnamed protein product [Lactuca virosa]|uniref:Transmembrane protein n=1 Tax=Lactuca virosa TaxID=75947 RepID=A0AAU9NX67_9ASTR|nr:unnamed protein product [Lactuca virosa]